MPLTAGKHIGASLTKAFDANVASIPGAMGEVVLFRALRSALGSLKAPQVHAREYHGNQFQVQHDPLGSLTHLGRSWCELSDLAIIVVAPPIKEVRLTFLQAKYVKSESPCSGWVPADLVQWSLLGMRPRIVDAKPSFVPRPPADLLSSAELPSIGSFGFFHQCPDCTGSPVKMAYASADALTPAVPGPRGGLGKRGHVSFPPPAAPPWHSGRPRLRRTGGLADVLVAYDLTDFGAAIGLGLIGSPVRPGSPDATWVIQLCWTLATLRGHDPLLESVLSTLDAASTWTDFPLKVSEEPGPHPSVVIVRTDLPTSRRVD